MSPEAVSPLRKRMIEDMTIRQFSEKTRRDDIRQVRAFTAFLGRSPDRAEPEDLRRYQLHLASLGASYARMNQASTALRFFFHVTRAAQARRLCSHPRGPPPTASRRTIDPVATSLTPSPPGRAARQIPIGLGSVATAQPPRGFLLWRLS